jgi:hypothetical protein
MSAYLRENDAPQSTCARVACLPILPVSARVHYQMEVVGVAP